MIDYTWIKDLKVGDEVAIDVGRYSAVDYRIAKVDKITPAGNIKIGDRIYNGKDGWERGGMPYERNILRQLTPELRAKIADKAERDRLLTRIRKVDMFKLPTAKLRAIAAILESEQAE